jgi:hypothetical protein
VKCGTKTCAGGEYCCNASCSRCAAKGMMCTQEACGPGGGAAPQ